MSKGVQAGRALPLGVMGAEANQTAGEQLLVSSSQLRLVHTPSPVLSDFPIFQKKSRILCAIR